LNTISAAIEPHHSAPAMHEITVTLPDGRVSIHKRPDHLPNDIVFVDRSMSADEFFALIRQARDCKEEH
jgi:hypothetical protein